MMALNRWSSAREIIDDPDAFLASNSSHRIATGYSAGGNRIDVFFHVAHIASLANYLKPEAIFRSRKPTNDAYPFAGYVVRTHGA